ncbi:MAG: glutamine-hydrolyzing carbamoyl-phosphate synthase small subunit [Clostridia bacterium]|nr:glutamine-hydrolyzing carbamoyl-phosphate synthase small subunit [Clostridia bacterium]
MKKKVYLTLQNGDSFQGYRFGAEGEITGELVFSTGMVGYMETLTDPANYGQIVVQTFPLIGNYGAIRKDAESERAWASAYVVREICEEPSNFRSEGKLEDYLKEQGVIGVYGVDTRELTKILREKGAMNARVSSKPLTEEEIEKLSACSTEHAVQTVAPKAQKTHGERSAAYTVALWNFGVKNSTVNNLVAQGLYVIDMPASSTAEDILATGADGVVLAGGAGDPAENGAIVAEVKKLLGKKPVFGMEYGHAFVALALGAKTAKQKYGHRGGNQPVKCLDCGRVYITSQNHGYEVVKETVKEGTVNFVNVNDGSCEGIDYPERNAFTVQFAPEACDLGNVENPLYKKFFALMKKEKENA